MRESKFQIEVTTGRLTLPVVAIFSLVLWSLSIQDWNELISLGLFVIIGYLIIETNTTFTLIRTRTTMPVCLYWCFATVLFFLHPFEWGNLVTLTFLLSVYYLFKSYESTQPAIPIYHTFLFIGIGSIIFPQLIYFAPLFFASMIPFRSYTLKSFIASLLGLITPFWFVFGYAFYFEQIHLLTDPIEEMIHFYPINYTTIKLNEGISWGVITLSLLIGSFHYWKISYTDKTRTRIYHSFMIFAGLWTILLSILQPIHLRELLQIQLILTAFLNGHLFTLTRNRFSNIYFIVTFVTLTILLIYNYGCNSSIFN